MSLSKKHLLQKFLKGIETGDAMAAAVVDEDRYLQHNPETGTGGQGIAELFARISKTNPKVRFLRVFEDGDFAFAHIEYDFADVKAAFELFRFDGDRAVEHWDNLQLLQPPNASGRGMLDGETEVSDLVQTEANRARARDFADTVLVGRALGELDRFVAPDLIQHAPDLADGADALRAALQAEGEVPPLRAYRRVHRVLAEGNFTLCQGEADAQGVHSGLYDLFRWADGRIVEQWSTIEAIPPRERWKNQNGKF